MIGTFEATEKKACKGSNGPTMLKSPFPLSSTMKRYCQTHCIHLSPRSTTDHTHTHFQGAERSVLTGDGQSETNLIENPGRPPRINQRNYNVESEYEYGSRAGFWRLFRLFSKFNLKFTLYAVAQAIEEVPEVAKRCVEKGHDVASHGWRWIDYHDLGVEAEEAMVRKAVSSLKALTGYAPKGWYYGRGSPQSRTLVPRVYEEMGEELVWYSDTYADDVSTDVCLLGMGRTLIL